MSRRLAIAGAIAAVAGLLLVLALIAGVVLRSSDYAFGTGFGLVPFFTADAAVAVAAAGLVAALVIAILAVRSRSRASGAAQASPSVKAGIGSPTVASGVRGAADRRRRRVGLVTAAAIAAASLLLFLSVDVLGMSYGILGDLVMLGAAAVAIVGLVAAVIVALRALLPGRRTTSLRTRAFFVIAIAVLIPSLCLAAFGVWAYYRSWETATTLSSDQARYRAGSSPRRSSPSSDSRTGSRQSSAPASPARSRGCTACKGIRRARSSPRWPRSARRARCPAGPSSPSSAVAMPSAPKPAQPSTGPNPEIVAWRVGPRVVRYYVPFWTDGIVSAPVPVNRLLWIALLGVVLIVGLGLSGAWLLSRSVVRPVRRLAAASGRLADGEAGVTVTPEGPRELRELATSFNDMNAKLTKAQETEQAFLLSVSHELKTPLTSVRGYAEGIGDGTVTPADGAAVIGAESSRLERLVGDLLDSARMRKSAFTVRRETVDLVVLAQDVARRYEGTARDAGLALHLKTEAGGSVIADNDRVLQVVSNLVENAIRCTPPPGSVTITTAPCAVTVADTGRGLTSDDLPRAFERFYLYSRYGTDRPVGTGLGLAIVKELTEAMGGTVSVSSAVGVGTAFTVALPPAEEASTAAAAAGRRGGHRRLCRRTSTSSTVALPRDDAS